MANYVKATNFAVKDTLASGNPAKIVKGTEIDSELTAIAAAVSSKSDSESPTFTGTPLAPTPLVATNNTQISTTAYVVNRIAQDITAPLALKANLASPIFTGTPTAPTPATEDNSTKLATTAYVVNKINAIAAGVTSFSTGTTGLTPSASTTGAVTLAGKLNVANGGTGQESYTNGQLLIGNSTGNTLAKGTLTAGTGISITNGAGSITIANTLPSSVNAQVFTTVGASTFTIPANVTKLKVTVVGGGGSGGYAGVNGCTVYPGGGGGAGGTAVKWLSGLTPGNTLSVTVGAGGTPTNSGVTSSVASGTQSITTIQATGGSVGGSGNFVSGPGAGGIGGLGSNGELNIRGGSGGNGAAGFGGSGGSSTLGGGGSTGAVGGVYGGGGGGSAVGFNNGAAGASGVVIFEW